MNLSGNVFFHIGFENNDTYSKLEKLNNQLKSIKMLLVYSINKSMAHFFFACHMKIISIITQSQVDSLFSSLYNIILVALFYCCLFHTPYRESWNSCVINAIFQIIYRRFSIIEIFTEHLTLYN